MPLEAGRAKAGPRSLGAPLEPLTLGSWVAVALWGPSGRTTNSSRDHPHLGGSEPRPGEGAVPGPQPLPDSQSELGKELSAPQTFLTCPTPHVTLVASDLQGGSRAVGQGEAAGRACPPLGEFAERHGPVADIPDS